MAATWYESAVSNRTGNYQREAARAFLRGTMFNAPFEAVESGVRTISQWCEALDQARLEVGIALLEAQREDVDQRAAQILSDGWVRTAPESFGAPATH